LTWAVYTGRLSEDEKQGKSTRCPVRAGQSLVPFNMGHVRALCCDCPSNRRILLDKSVDRGPLKPKESGGIRVCIYMGEQSKLGGLAGAAHTRPRSNGPDSSTGGMRAPERRTSARAPQRAGFGSRCFALIRRRRSWLVLLLSHAALCVKCGEALPQPGASHTRQEAINASLQPFVAHTARRASKHGFAMPLRRVSFVCRY